MRVRNWLLTGTSLTFLAFAPVGAAHAQDANDPALAAAFQAYQADQSDATRQKLNEACIAAGFQSLDDCIAALSGGNSVKAPAAPTEPAPAADAPAADAPAADAPAADTPPPAEAAPADATPPAVEAPSSSEEPAPVPKKKKTTAAPAVESSSEAPAPAVEAPAPAVEAPAPAVEAPVSSSEEAAPPPSSEQAAPAPSSEAPAAPAETAAPKKLVAAVALYNEGAAQLDAGDAAGQAKVDKARAEIDAICQTGGFADTESCLAQFGLTLNPLPPAAAPASSEAPVASSEAPAATSEAPAEQPAASETPMSEMPNASEAVTPSAVEVLPPDVAPSEAAPILDSAKDQQVTTSVTDTTPTDQSSSSELAAPAEPPAPPPTTDAEATADIPPPAPEQQTALGDKGTKADVTFIEPKPPENAPNVTIIQPPKTDKNKPSQGVVFQIGINIYINNPQQERDRYYDARQDQIEYEDLSRGRTRETITHKDGSQVVTIYNRNGDVLQRSKITRDGREIVLATYDPRDSDNLDNWRDPGEDLPPLRLTIPASDYILDADTADENDVAFFLDKPPVEKVQRIYSIDEVKRSARLRDSVRRLEVGGLRFDSGKATISRDQVGTLSKVADAMTKLLDKNQGEVFLIEGHTDAVGSDVSNLVLSDQRAATVARILTDFYDIPAENLVTQGYGERYLKVNTEAAEPINRRVTIKRITPLVSYSDDK